jgi:hypothetical protein
MNKLLTLTVAAAVLAFSANSASAQCVGCSGGVTPAFSSPVMQSYGTPVYNSAPSYSAQPVYSQPAYNSAPSYPTYSQPMASTQVMSQPIMSQPMMSQPVMSQPIISNAQPVMSGQIVSQPVTAQPIMSQPVMSQPIVQQPMYSSAPVSSCCGGGVAQPYYGGETIVNSGYAPMNGTYVEGGYAAPAAGTYVDGGTVVGGSVVGETIVGETVVSDVQPTVETKIEGNAIPAQPADSTPQPEADSTPPTPDNANADEGT